MGVQQYTHQKGRQVEGLLRNTPGTFQAHSDVLWPHQLPRNFPSDDEHDLPRSNPHKENHGLYGRHIDFLKINGRTYPNHQPSPPDPPRQ